MQGRQFSIIYTCRHGNTLSNKTCNTLTGQVMEATYGTFITSARFGSNATT